LITKESVLCGADTEKNLQYRMTDKPPVAGDKGAALPPPAFGDFYNFLMKLTRF